MNKLQQRLVKFSPSVFDQVQAIHDLPLMESVAIQLLRSSTSIGANYSEAQSASSYRDFHNKVRIALKEMKETQYWICFLRETKVVTDDLDAILKESEELMRILSTISKKTDPRRKPDQNSK